MPVPMIAPTPRAEELNRTQNAAQAVIAYHFVQQQTKRF